MSFKSFNAIRTVSKSFYFAPRSTSPALRYLITVPVRYSSTSLSVDQPLLVTYKNGSYRFDLNVNGPVAFNFAPDVKLGVVIQSVKDESQGSATNVVMADSEGNQLSHDITIGDALRGGRAIQIGLDERKFPVVIARSTGFGDPELEGSTEFHSLLEKSRILELRAKLKNIRNRSIPFSEFAAICQGCSIPEVEATRIASDLHRVGEILYFSKDSELSNTVYLKPDEVLEDLFSRYGLDSPLQRYLSCRLTELDEAALSLEETIQPMKALKATLDERATKSASRYIWVLTSGILGGMGGYWYLVYVHFSWDIMEPVTFFTGLGISTIGYTWWMATNKEYEYSNVYDFFLRRAKRLGYVHGGFDMAKYNELHDRLAEIKKETEEVEARKFQLDAMGISVARAEAST